MAPEEDREADGSFGSAGGNEQHTPIVGCGHLLAGLRQPNDHNPVVQLDANDVNGFVLLIDRNLVARQTQIGHAADPPPSAR